MKKKTLEELSKLNTKRLLSYYKSQRLKRIMYMESFYTGWEYEFHLYKDMKYVLDELNEWEDYLNLIKSILSTRENILKK